MNQKSIAIILKISEVNSSKSYSDKVDHFKVKLRLPLVYHLGFSIKSDGVDGGEDNGDDGCNSFLLVSKICIFDKSLYTTVTNYA